VLGVEFWVEFVKLQDIIPGETTYQRLTHFTDHHINSLVYSTFEVNPLTKNVKYILLFCFFIAGKYSMTQQIYFNHRYHLSESQATYSATSILEHNGNYYISGATQDTITQDWEWIFFMQLSDSGFVKEVNYIGDNEHDYYTGWPGSSRFLNDHLYYVGNKVYYFSQSHWAGLMGKLNINLDTVWSREFFGNIPNPYTNRQYFNNMFVCDDGDLIITGELYHYSGTPSEVILLKTDSTGDEKWSMFYGQSGFNIGYSVIQTSDGGFAIGGYWRNPNSPSSGDPIVIKTDSIGNMEWEVSLGGPRPDNKAMLCRGSDGSIIVGTLYADSTTHPIWGDPYSRIHIVKLDNNGNTIWDRKYGKSNVTKNYVSNIRCLDDGSIIVCGSSPVDYNVTPGISGWVMKLNTDGDELWYRSYANLYGGQSENILNDIIPTSDKGFIACGFVLPEEPDTGVQEVWVIKLDSMGCDTPGCGTVGVSDHARSIDSKSANLHIFPNPASTQIMICSSVLVPRSSVFIYDLFGRLQDEIIITKGQNETKLDISAYPPGVYIAVLKDDKGLVSRGKFVKR